MRSAEQWTSGAKDGMWPTVLDPSTAAAKGWSPQAAPRTLSLDANPRPPRPLSASAGKVMTDGLRADRPGQLRSPDSPAFVENSLLKQNALFYLPSSARGRSSRPVSASPQTITLPVSEPPTYGGIVKATCRPPLPRPPSAREGAELRTTPRSQTDPLEARRVFSGLSDLGSDGDLLLIRRLSNSRPLSGRSLAAHLQPGCGAAAERSPSTSSLSESTESGDESSDSENEFGDTPPYGWLPTGGKARVRAGSGAPPPTPIPTKRSSSKVSASAGSWSVGKGSWKQYRGPLPEARGARA